MEMQDFLKVIDWLHSIGGQFGFDHIVIGCKTYYLDDKEHRFDLWKNYTDQLN